MKINENFIKEILIEHYKDNYQKIYDNSYLIQYLDKKTKAIHSDSKSRRSLANIYAIYSLLYYYKKDYYNKADEYKKFEGYNYTNLSSFCKNLYGGRKLQNHALNSRVNSEFKNKFSNLDNTLIITNNGKYLIHIDYLYVNNIDISEVACKIIEKYIELLRSKDKALINTLTKLQKIKNYNEKKEYINNLITEDAEARIFEIISYAILKAHYKNIKVYFGYFKDDIKEVCLELFKTGRTNANDGGIDFVMRPIGRFFQVTEVNNYNKYLLDIDKVMHFPISFVIKTTSPAIQIMEELNNYIKKRSSGMRVIEQRYINAIEEIITINELKSWIIELNEADINEIIQDIDIYYKLELNIELENEE